MLMAYEITRDFPLKEVEIETPICRCKEKMLAGKKVGVVPILRAGLGMLNGVVNMIPAARVGHVGMYRDPKTLKPVEYYCKLPGDVAERTLIVVDPMLATGGSSMAAPRCSRRRALLISSSCAPSPRLRASASSTTTIQMCRLRRRSHRREAQRQGLHRPGPRRCRRPHLWHTVIKCEKSDLSNLEVGIVGRRTSARARFQCHHESRRRGSELPVLHDRAECRRRRRTRPAPQGPAGELHNSKKTTPASALLARHRRVCQGARPSEGLGNKFLEHIRQVDVA